MVMIIDCDKCRESEECPKKGELQRSQFFAFAGRDSVGCPDYEPHRFRGLEGVAA